ncbi:MAG: hypothetical protein RBT11_11125 [Desulfobacterales bacterium]|jgi:hypothetical protein|nr:hypothetical protein [Desulfobacterales bacterium]
MARQHQSAVVVRYEYDRKGGLKKDASEQALQYFTGTAPEHLFFPIALDSPAADRTIDKPANIPFSMAISCLLKAVF